MNLLKKLFGVVSLSLLSCLLVPQTAEAQTSLLPNAALATDSIPNEAFALDQLRLNENYDPKAKYAVGCNINLLDFKFLAFEMTTLSTYGINACDPKVFRNLTAASAKAQLDTFQPIKRVVLVGPFVQLMDRNASTVSNPYLSIGLLNFSVISTARIGIKDIFTNTHTWRKWSSKVTIYNSIKMAENVDYLWLPGSKIYTLTNDQGHVFVMSQLLPSGIGVEIKGIEELAENLAQHLNLPTGWHYEVKTLTKILRIRRQADLGNTTERLADEYSNFYIRVNNAVDNAIE